MGQYENHIMGETGWQGGEIWRPLISCSPPQGLIIRELETSLGSPSYTMLLGKSFIFLFEIVFAFVEVVDTRYTFLENSTQFSEPC